MSKLFIEALEAEDELELYQVQHKITTILESQKLKLDKEDECSHCNVNNQVWIDNGYVDCPHCMDDNLRLEEFMQSGYNKHEDSCQSENTQRSKTEDEFRSEDNSLDEEQRDIFYGDRPDYIEEVSPELKDYIESLEDSLFFTDIEYDQCLVRGMQKNREISRLEEQIAEARDYVEQCSKYFNLNPQKRDWQAVAESAYTRFDNLLELLTPDSDEGNGCDG